MARIVVKEAEKLIDKPIPVLDKGFVRLVDYLGGDQRIVQAARVSYGSGTKSYREDKGLIHYLYRNRHTSPFEQVILTFHCKLPIFVARQWIRHRTARLNELSGRYSVMSDEFYLPAEERVQAQSTEDRQASGERLPARQARRVRDMLSTEQQSAYWHYNEILSAGVARELARINLPLSLYTEWYWQIDLHNLFHFLRLRLDEHAQYEIRQYAKVMGKCAKAVAPMAYGAFEEYDLLAARFSSRELKLLRRIAKKAGLEPDSDLSSLSKLPKKRLSEFVRKLWGDAGGIEPPEFKPDDRGG